MRIGFTVKASESVGGSTADLTKKTKGSLSSLNKVIFKLKEDISVYKHSVTYSLRTKMFMLSGKNGAAFCQLLLVNLS